MPIKCLKCGSEQITSKIIASKENLPTKTVVVCLNCGNEWNPKDYDRLKRRKAQKEEDRRMEAWTNDFYRAIETGDMVKAQSLLKQSSELSKKFTNPKDAYDFLKKRDKNTSYILIGFVLVIIVVMIYLMSYEF